MEKRQYDRSWDFLNTFVDPSTGRFVDEVDNLLNVSIKNICFTPPFNGSLYRFGDSPSEVSKQLSVAIGNNDSISYFELLEYAIGVKYDLPDQDDIDSLIRQFREERDEDYTLGDFFLNSLSEDQLRRLLISKSDNVVFWESLGDGAYDLALHIHLTRLENQFIFSMYRLISELGSGDVKRFIGIDDSVNVSKDAGLLSLFLMSEEGYLLLASMGIIEPWFMHDESSFVLLESFKQFYSEVVSILCQQIDDDSCESEVYFPSVGLIPIIACLLVLRREDYDSKVPQVYLEHKFGSKTHSIPDASDIIKDLYSAWYRPSTGRKRKKTACKMFLKEIANRLVENKDYRVCYEKVNGVLSDVYDTPEKELEGCQDGNRILLRYAFPKTRVRHGDVFVRSFSLNPDLDKIYLAFEGVGQMVSDLDKLPKRDFRYLQMLPDDKWSVSKYLKDHPKVHVLEVQSLECFELKRKQEEKYKTIRHDMKSDTTGLVSSADSILAIHKNLSKKAPSSDIEKDLFLLEKNSLLLKDKVDSVKNRISLIGNLDVEAFSEHHLLDWLQRRVRIYEDNYPNIKFTLSYSEDEMGGLFANFQENNFNVMLTAIVENAKVHGFDNSDIEGPTIDIQVCRLYEGDYNILLSVKNNGKPFRMNKEMYSQFGAKSDESLGSGIGGYRANEIAIRHGGYVSPRKESDNTVIDIYLALDLEEKEYNYVHSVSTLPQDTGHGETTSAEKLVIAWCDDKIDSIRSALKDNIDWDRNVIIKPFARAQDLYDWLRINGSLVDAVILDYNMGDTAINVSEDKHTGFNAALHHMDDTYCAAIPHFIYSGHSREEIEKTISDESDGNKFEELLKHYHSQGDLSGLLSDIRNTVNKDKLASLLRNVIYKEGFDAWCGFFKLDESSLIKILASDASNVLASLVTVRIDIEKILDQLKTKSLVPSGVHLSGLPNFLAGKDLFYQYDESFVGMPEPLFKAFKQVVNDMLNLSHDNPVHQYLDDSGDVYFARYLCCILLDATMWCKGYSERCNKDGVHHWCNTGGESFNIVKFDSGKYGFIRNGKKYELEPQPTINLNEGCEVRVLEEYFMKPKGNIDPSIQYHVSKHQWRLIQ